MAFAVAAQLSGDLLEPVRFGCAADVGDVGQQRTDASGLGPPQPVAGDDGFDAFVEEADRFGCLRCAVSDQFTRVNGLELVGGPLGAILPQRSPFAFDRGVLDPLDRFVSCRFGGFDVAGVAAVGVHADECGPAGVGGPVRG